MVISAINNVFATETVCSSIGINSIEGARDSLLKKIDEQAGLRNSQITIGALVIFKEVNTKNGGTLISSYTACAPVKIENR